MMNDPNEVTIPATGNFLTRNEHEHTFLAVSGGSGNINESEVHLMITSRDGEFAQGWFQVSDLLQAIGKAMGES